MRVPEFVAACRAEGLLGGVWETMPNLRVWSGIDFYIAELERKLDTGFWAPEHRKLNPDLPTGYITNLDTHGEPDYFKPMVAAGYTCITECYLSDNPNATPERMAFTAAQHGIPYTQPCISTYDGTYPAPDLASLGLDAWPGWSIYLAEYSL